MLREPAAFVSSPGLPLLPANAVQAAVHYAGSIEPADRFASLGAEVAAGMSPLNDVYGVLERYLPEVASLARFAHGIEVAIFHMAVAFEKAGVCDFDAEIERRTGPVSHGNWLLALADTTFVRFKALRRALMHTWTPPTPEAELLTYTAFKGLCDLTPVSSHSLKQLFLRQRPEAIEQLVRQLDPIAEVLESAFVQPAGGEAGTAATGEDSAAALLKTNQDVILERAGEPLGLRKAAEQLGMSHQNLHKRVVTGSALGVMRGRELIVPSIQFVRSGEGLAIVPGLKKVIALFDEAKAGRWMALQFLTDLAMGDTHAPIEALRAGSVDAVVGAARAYLGLDES